MTNTHSSAMGRQYADEVVYGGGVGAGTIAIPVSPATIGDTTPCLYPFLETQEFPKVDFQQVAMEAAGQDITTKQTFTVDKLTTPGKMVQTIQNDVWIDYTLDGTAGAIPTVNGSWCEVFTDGQQQQIAYGCHVVDYTVEIPKPSPTDLPKETVVYNAYNVLDSALAGVFAWTAGAVKRHNDVTLNVGGEAVSNYESCKINIIKTYTEKQAGTELNTLPYLNTKDWSFEITTYDYLGSFNDKQTEAVNLISIIVTGLYSVPLTYTNMKLKEVNVKEMPGEKGLMKYTAVYEIGGVSTLLKA